MAVRGPKRDSCFLTGRRGVTGSYWLSRVRLGSAASVKALLPLLQQDAGPSGHGSVDVDRRLVWSLFADEPDRRRDFLWRRMEDGTFLLLSARRPVDHHGLFEIEEPKNSPRPGASDRLRFSLRANPTRRKRKGPADRHAPRHDVVMDALYPLPVGTRADRRMVAIREEGLRWLADRGEDPVSKYGKTSCCAKVTANTASIAASATRCVFLVPGFRRGAGGAGTGLVAAAIAHGFGPAKAFGCGLMLIRRL